MQFKSPVILIVAVVLAVAVSSAITWHFARNDLREDTIQPVAALLDANAKLVESLKKAEGVDSEAQILPTYLAMVRKDGVPKHSDLKQQIDELVNNNTTAVALLTRYTEHGANASFRMAAHQYTDYATALRVRWQSVFELFMAGGSLPATPVSPPPAILQGVQSAE